MKITVGSESFALLGYYAASSGNLSAKFRGNLSAPSSGLTWGWDRQVVTKQWQVFTNTRRVITQKNTVLCYFETEVWNHVQQTTLYSTFLGVFSKLRKATISFVIFVRPSVCLSVRMEQLGSHWTYFHKIWNLFIFSKLCREKSSFFKIWRE
jgi:hypothetical protein